MMVLEVYSTDNQVPDMTVNKYEESVEFQNECRSFYLHRVKATEHFKQKLQSACGTENKEQKKSSMSSAMDRLRVEMASLVDQDLSLMKQMLTLNETIEELKNKRLYGVSKGSLDDSTCQLGKSLSTMSIDSGSASECNTEDDTNVQSAPYKCFDHQDSEDSGYGE